MLLCVGEKHCTVKTKQNPISAQQKKDYRSLCVKGKGKGFSQLHVQETSVNKPTTAGV